MEMGRRIRRCACVAIMLSGGIEGVRVMRHNYEARIVLHVKQIQLESSVGKWSVDLCTSLRLRCGNYRSFAPLH